MNYFYKLSIAFILTILITNCSVNGTKNIIAPVDLEQLVDKLPAADSIGTKLIFNNILQKGSESIVTLASILDKDSTRNAKTEYAVNGIVNYLGKYTQLKPVFTEGLSSVLLNKFSYSTKIFFLEQYGLIAGAEAADLLEPYIFSPQLSPIIIKILSKTRSSNAAELLYDSFDTFNERIKETAIYALAEMEYKDVAEKIFEQRDDKDLSSSVLFAMAKLGHRPAENYIQQELPLNSDKGGIYPLYIKQIALAGDKDHALYLCRDLLENIDKYPQTIQIAVLALYTEIEKKDAFELLAHIYKNGDKKTRSAVTQIAAQNGYAENSKRWIDFAKSLAVEQKLEIISMLLQHENEFAKEFIRQCLFDSNQTVCLTALPALNGVLRQEAAEDIKNMLLVNLSDIVLEGLKNILLTSTDPTLIANVSKHFSEFPQNSKNILLEVWRIRHSSEYMPLLVKVLKQNNDETLSSVLNVLAEIGTQDNLFDLLTLYSHNNNQVFERAYKICLINILNRNAKNKTSVKQLIEFFDNSDDDSKIKLLAVFKGVGGFSFFEKTKTGLYSQNVALKEAAKEVILNWPDINALETLLNWAGNAGEETQILAIRSASKIIRESNLAEPIAIEYLKTLMNASKRVEEKRLVLASASKYKCMQAVRFISSYIDNDELYVEAYLAVINAFSNSEKDSQHEFVESLLQGVMNETLAKEIREQNNKPIKPPEGFYALFNGLDLTNWKGLVENPVKRGKMSSAQLDSAQKIADKNMHAHWKVVDDFLFFDGKGQSICTIKEYKNFEMMVDWKIEKEGDSGIYLRGSPQVQIWDPEQWPEGSGGLYNNQVHPNKPNQNADNPVGQWNTFRIIMRGQKVTVYLNGTLVVDNVIMENYWEREKPIYPSGQIELQAHYTPLYFKNIFIRELPDEPDKFSGFLFNGKNLEGWQAIDGDADWQAMDSILFINGAGGGWLSTEKEFADFKLELEFRLPAGGNSGVFVRAPHEGDPAYSGIEIQVLDDYAAKYSTLKPWQYTGSLYGLESPVKRASKKAGTWQKMTITCIGPEIKVDLNNELIINSNIIKFMDKADTHPGIKNRKGYIGLQNHNTKIEYRNIRLTEY